MMIKQKISGIALAVTLAFGVLSPLPAQTGTTLSPAGQSTIDGRAWLTFTSPDGMRILALAPFPEDARQRLEKTVTVISSWPTIRITELRAESSKGVDDYVLSFPSLQYEGREYSSNVPGGLRLRFDGALMYDFRVRSSDYFVRVRGVLMDEASLLSEIAKAVQDPGAYIAERDPAWLALRIEQLDKFDLQLVRRLDQQDSRTAEINQHFTRKVDEGAALIESRTLAMQARMDSLAADLATDLEQRKQEAAQDRNTFTASQSRMEALAGTLRLALASEMNRGFFGGPKPLDAAVLDQVLTFKASNASADRAAALEHAKAAELKPKAKEIDIIFKLWFDE
jgi:hypothetical protein